ncbi:MAG TPA: hypothetical protein VHQ90_09315 [Thermoanaerobaculia bacterium]|nr:hypothetical protein [Thermoanaerobaculia bacterium]
MWQHIHPWQIVALIILGAYLVYARRKRIPEAGARGPGAAARAKTGQAPRAEARATAAAARQAARPVQTPEETYMDLRRQALDADPARLGLAGDEAPGEPYGVLMEMGMSNSVVTLACFADGDARLFYKTGGGMIGGISHDSVRKVSKDLVALARKAAPRMIRTTNHPLPGPDRVRFYVLTVGGVLTTETSRQALGERQSELSELFQGGQEVVARMRQVGEQKAQNAGVG